MTGCSESGGWNRHERPRRASATTPLRVNAHGKEFRQARQRTLTLIAPTGGVTTGVGVLIGTIFVVALGHGDGRRAFEGAITGCGTSRS
jgi:hypothetical protein